VPAGDVEIHSELNDTAQPGYRGVKTTLIEREPSVTAARVAQDRAATRLLTEQPRVDKVFAEIQYEDDSGRQTYFITQNEVRIGRGGEDLWVDLPLYTVEEVSREHFEIRRDAATGKFFITDKSRNGTWVNGRKLSHGREEAMPDRAEIGVAAVMKLLFQVRK
jgi:pSer/pThr/pTyr-binding forkhead associated (FHA) protein